MQPVRHLLNPSTVPHFIQITVKILTQKGQPGNLQTNEEVPNIISHEKNANESYNEIMCHTPGMAEI